jgi:hypothetical protein
MPCLEMAVKRWGMIIARGILPTSPLAPILSLGSRGWRADHQIRQVVDGNEKQAPHRAAVHFMTRAHAVAMNVLSTVCKFETS